MNQKLKKVLYLFIILSTLGFIDSLYLLVSHFMGASVVCNGTSECDLVLTSQYATILGIPVAGIGVLYYAFMLFSSTFCLDKCKKADSEQTNLELKYLKYPLLATIIGFAGSVWFVYLQAFVIYAYCTYCLISAGLSTILMILSAFTYFKLLKKPTQIENARQ